MKTYCFRVFVCLIVAVSGSLSLNAQQQRYWVPVNPNVPAGSPVILKVLLADPLETRVEVSVPGFWVDEVMYGGKPYLRPSYPAIEFRGKGFPAKAGDPGWWDFPQALKQPRRNPARFIAGDGGVRRFLFPESAVGGNPQTAEQMQELGIDPEGARPGLPRLRPLIAMSRKNTQATVESRIEPGQVVSIPLQLPVAPAGFEGGDAEDGYNAPELVDEAFYQTFQGQYSGSEPLLGEIGGLGGAFSGAMLAIPALTLITPSVVQAMPVFQVYLKHLEGAEDFDCALPWDH